VKPLSRISCYIRRRTGCSRVYSSGAAKRIRSLSHCLVAACFRVFIRAKFEVEETSRAITMEVDSSDGISDVAFSARPATDWKHSTAFSTLEEASDFLRQGECSFSCSLQGDQYRSRSRLPRLEKRTIDPAHLHQLEHRVKAHVLVAFFGYALWVTLKHLLKRSHSETSPAKALELLATLQSADIVLPTTDG
jgi:hypothetical protein